MSTAVSPSSTRSTSAAPGSPGATGRTSWLAATLVAVGVQVAWLRCGGLWEYPTFPLDDAWIHQVFARSLASGQGFAYSAGAPSAGCSSPLWAVLLAVPASLGVPALTAGTTLSVAATGVAVVGGGAWASRLYRSLTGQLAPSWLGPVAIGALALCPTLAWNAGSGMEGPAAAAFGLSAGALRLGTPRERLAGALCFGFAVATRLEVAAAIPVLVVERLWVDRGGSWRARLWTAAADVVLAALPAALLLGLLHASTGRWLPQTLDVKVGELALSRVLPHLSLGAAVGEVLERLAFGVAAVWTVPTFQAPLVGGVLLALAVLVARGELRGRSALVLPAGWISIQVVAMELLPQPGGVLSHEGRYVVPLVMLGKLLALVGAAATGHVLGRRDPRGRRAGPVLVGLLVLFDLGPGLATARRALANRREIAHLQVELGAWIGARAGPGSVVAARDVGAVGYFAPDARVIDLLGLVSPEWLGVDRDPARFAALVRLAQPQYVEVFSGEWPEITAPCEEATRRVEPLATLASRREMVVYGCE